MIVRCAHDELLPVTKIKPCLSNENKHSPEQIDRLAKLLRYQGLRKPLIISNRSGLLVTGHCTLDAIVKNKWDKAPVSYQDFDSEDQETAHRIADNSIGLWAELNLGVINLRVPDFDGENFDIHFLGLKNFTVEPADKYGDKDADAVPETRKTTIEIGDLFQLGVHRLLCGDCTIQENVEKLMNGEKADMVYTDPPYGINLQVDYKTRYGNIKNRQYDSQIEGDYGSDPGVDWRMALDLADEVFVWGADNYPDYLSRGGSWVVWDKSVKAVDGIASDFELCWSKKRHHYSMIRKLWKGAKAREETGQEGAHRTRWGHPTQKPIELALYFFEHWGKKAQTILDLFLGSGTTLIACEKTNRKCFGMEIDPEYCQVIIDRWEKFTEQKAQKVN